MAVLRRLLFQGRMFLLACLAVLFGLGVIALAATEIADRRIGLGIWAILLFLLSVLIGYFGWDEDQRE